jgi:hypothetical protein
MVLLWIITAACVLLAVRMRPMEGGYFPDFITPLAQLALLAIPALLWLGYWLGAH